MKEAVEKSWQNCIPDAKSEPCHRPQMLPLRNEREDAIRIINKKERDAQNGDKLSKLLHDWIIILLIQLNAIVDGP